MDEYTTSWEDVVAAEPVLFGGEAAPAPSAELHQFGTLGRALWRERSFEWILRSNPELPQAEVQKLVASLAAASRPELLDSLPDCERIAVQNSLGLLARALQEDAAATLLRPLSWPQ
jgi:hypothetical protein